VHNFSSSNEKESEGIDLQVRHALRSRSLSGQVLLLEDLLVLSLQQGVTCAGLGEDEQGHDGRPLLSTVTVMNSER